MVMGCYGIGVSRLVAAIVEEHHDENGIVWPVAPRAVRRARDRDAGRRERYRSREAQRGAGAAGLDVLFDDREGRPGVKFADADLVGVPVQIIVGTKGLARGIVERKVPRHGERDDIPRDDAVATLVAGAGV